MSTLRVNTIDNLSVAGLANQIFYRDSNNIVSGSNNLTFDGNNVNIGSLGGSSALNITGYNAFGGTGYHGFLTVTNTFSSVSKFFRLNSAGGLEIINSAYNAVISTLDNAGNLTIAGAYYGQLFYDSNNTGYYLDPASTSLLNVLQIGTTTYPGGLLNVYNDGTIYSFRGAIIDAINFNNTVWADFNIRGQNVYLRTPDATPRLGVTGFDGKARTFNNGGSVGYDGIIITSPDDSIGNLRWVFEVGYVEAIVPGSAIGWNVFFSDENLKQNISPSVVNASELINKIKFIEFDWKPVTGRTGHVDVGVSAQNLQSIDERLVNVLSDDTVMVNEPVFVVHIAKALQEALSEIETLKTRISALESE